MDQPRKIPTFFNKTVEFILRSPLHGMISKNVLLISVTGRKTGKTYTFPVGYSRNNGDVYIFTHREWWRNVRQGEPLNLRIEGRELRGLPEVIREDKGIVAAALGEHLRKARQDAQWYKVTFDENDNPRTEELRRAAQNVTLVHLQLAY